MRDWLLTLVLAVALTVVAVVGLQVDRRVGPIGVTFGMCFLVAGLGVRLVMDTVARRRRRKR